MSSKATTNWADDESSEDEAGETPGAQRVAHNKILGGDNENKLIDNKQQQQQSNREDGNQSNQQSHRQRDNIYQGRTGGGDSRSGDRDYNNNRRSDINNNRNNSDHRSDGRNTGQGGPPPARRDYRDSNGNTNINRDYNSRGGVDGGGGRDNYGNRDHGRNQQQPQQQNSDNRNNYRDGGKGGSRASGYRDNTQISRGQSQPIPSVNTTNINTTQPPAQVPVVPAERTKLVLLKRDPALDAPNMPVINAKIFGDGKPQDIKKFEEEKKKKVESTDGEEESTSSTTVAGEKTIIVATDTESGAVKLVDETNTNSSQSATTESTVTTAGGQGRGSGRGRGDNSNVPRESGTSHYSGRGRGGRVGREGRNMNTNASSTTTTTTTTHVNGKVQSTHTTVKEVTTKSGQGETVGDIAASTTSVTAGGRFGGRGHGGRKEFGRGSSASNAAANRHAVEHTAATGDANIIKATNSLSDDTSLNVAAIAPVTAVDGEVSGTKSMSVDSVKSVVIHDDSSTIDTTIETTPTESGPTATIRNKDNRSQNNRGGRITNYTSNNKTDDSSFKKGEKPFSSSSTAATERPPRKSRDGLNAGEGGASSTIFNKSIAAVEKNRGNTKKMAGVVTTSTSKIDAIENTASVTTPAAVTPVVSALPVELTDEEKFNRAQASFAAKSILPVTAAVKIKNKQQNAFSAFVIDDDDDDED